MAIPLSLLACSRSHILLFVLMQPFPFLTVLIDGFIEDNISIVIEGSRDKRVKKMETVYKVVKAASIRRSASLSEADRPSDRSTSGNPDICGMLINNAAFSDAVMDDVLYEENEPTGVGMVDEENDLASFGMAGGHVDASDTFEFAVGDRVSVGLRGLGAVLFAGKHQKNGEPRYALGTGSMVPERSSIAILTLPIGSLPAGFRAGFGPGLSPCVCLIQVLG